MNTTNQYITKLSRLIFLIVTSLTACFYPAFCEENSVGINEKLAEKQYRSYFNEFQRAFGKQMEREFSLKWIEEGLLYDFSRDKPEFYA